MPSRAFGTPQPLRYSVDLERFQRHVRRLRRSPSYFRKTVSVIESLPPPYLLALETLDEESVTRPILGLLPGILAATIAMGVIQSIPEGDVGTFFPTPREDALKEILREWRETPDDGRLFVHLQLWEAVREGLGRFHPRLGREIEQLVRERSEMESADQELTLFVLAAFFSLAVRSQASIAHAVSRMATYTAERSRQLARLHEERSAPVGDCTRPS